ncbi:hypothetical protein BpHYR1_048429 [Brachionus plicatilis]|uniref:Uncharacterized protein n=1 Tax=Brachionus plicatilis TaxID=10195 RepID=A0A3M7SSA4_BRAPC|nr:hypothetical protein BpHYR1_048429 [Brachionus plicatilis]
MWLCCPAAERDCSTSPWSRFSSCRTCCTRPHTPPPLPDCTETGCCIDTPSRRLRSKYGCNYVEQMLDERKNANES